MLAKTFTINRVAVRDEQERDVEKIKVHSPLNLILVALLMMRGCLP